MADHYQVLGVGREAGAAEIRQAYLRLAREKHPDRFLDPVEKEKAQDFFKEATAAFNTLSNERARREYDAELARPRLTAPADLGRDAYARGLKCLQARDYQGAVELLRGAVHHAPGEAEYHAALALALSRNPHWAREAIQEMERAVQLAPQDPAHHARLAELFLRQGLRLRARKALERALELEPANPEVQRVAAEVEAAEGAEGR